MFATLIAFDALMESKCCYFLNHIYSWSISATRGYRRVFKVSLRWMRSIWGNFFLSLVGGCIYCLIIVVVIMFWKDFVLVNVNWMHLHFVVPLLYLDHAYKNTRTCSDDNWLHVLVNYWVFMKFLLHLIRENLLQEAVSFPVNAGARRCRRQIWWQH